jgi:UDP-N-acetylglucosamine 2-epimerase
MKVLCVFGTRPEAIKMAPVVRELRKYPVGVDVRVCVTGQHRQMLDQVLRLFEIVPDHDLQIMRADQSLTELTTAALKGLDALIALERPEWMVVQGDTTTAMAAALVAFYHRVRIAHVEAGLRSWNLGHPFPEEANRRIADGLSNLHFAPTEAARQNLLREGVDAGTILVTGNTVIDALQWVAALPAPADLDAFTAADDASRLVLVTAHRRESFGPGIEAICLALRDLATRYGDGVRVVYPVHLNPRVREPVHRILGDLPNVVLAPPLDYLRFVHLMKRAYLVLTDSGGIQEEAPGLGKPVLVLREVTERPEAVEAGTARVVGTTRERVVCAASRLLDDPAEYTRMAHAANPFGDGHAARRIVAALLAS